MTAPSRLPLSLMFAFSLLACADGDSVVALNVNFAASASAARTIAVSITQSGQSPADSTLTVPTKDSDAGLVLKDTRFVQRITLPAGYTDAEATIKVVAKDAADKEIDSATATFNPRPSSATAAFVTVGKDKPATTKSESDAGTDGAAGEAAKENAAGAAGAAGEEGAAGAAGK